MAIVLLALWRPSPSLLRGNHRPPCSAMVLPLLIGTGGHPPFDRCWVSSWVLWLRLQVAIYGHRNSSSPVEEEKTRLLTHQTPAILGAWKIHQAYEERFKEDLFERLESELSGDFEPKQIHEIKDFRLTARRKDARSVKIKRSKEISLMQVQVNTLKNRFLINSQILNVFLSKSM